MTTTALDKAKIDLAVQSTVGAAVNPDSVAGDAQSGANRSVLRVTNSIAQYDVSNGNDRALGNLGKALAGSLDRDDFTFFDPESKADRRLGDILVTVDLTNPKEIVLLHRDTAGKGSLGRVAQSVSYLTRNPINTVGMKLLGIVADPELIYKQKVTQILAQLDREGLFGPPGASTFNIDDWSIETREAWRDVVITRRSDQPEPVELKNVSFGESFRNSFKAFAA